MNVQTAASICNPLHYDQARIVEIARSNFIAMRRREMLDDPLQCARVMSQAYCTHPTLAGETIISIMKERVGSLADLLDMMDKAAEDLAQQEWADHRATRVAA